MLTAVYRKYILQFKEASGTSRGVLHTKETFFLKISSDKNFGIGECGLFRGLSYDDMPDYVEKLQWLCDHIHLDKDLLLKELIAYPSIQFGLEQAFLSFQSQDMFSLFPSKFTRSEDSIAINGLIWMGDASFMQKQIKEKLTNGFTTIKLKIGAINFDAELNLLKSIRKNFLASEIELRVDANGAFTPKNALEKLKRLSDFELHSIEQPIRAGQHEEMARLCAVTPLPIALDEELIGVLRKSEKELLVKMIQPQFIILKPSLIGGFSGTDEWIQVSQHQQIGWWITSALESNIGLNAIAQFTYLKETKIPQGLGTGSLFTNNLTSPLEVKNGGLFYSQKRKWKNIESLF